MEIEITQTNCKNQTPLQNPSFDDESINQDLEQPTQGIITVKQTQRIPPNTKKIAIKTQNQAEPTAARVPKAMVEKGEKWAQPQDQVVGDPRRQGAMEKTQRVTQELQRST